LKPHRIPALCLLACLLLGASLAPAAQAAPAPAWSLSFVPTPANFTPGGTARLFGVATNVGAAATTGATEIEVTLPGDLTPLAADTKGSCVIAAPLITCEAPDPVRPGDSIFINVSVAVAATPTEPSTTTFSLSGGAALPASVSTAPVYQSDPVPFGFLAPGLSAPLSEEDGLPASLAASHPYQQTTSFNFPTYSSPVENSADKLLTNAGHPRNIEVDLPAGLIGNPAATPVLCTEVQLLGSGCSDDAAIGVLNVTTIAGAPDFPAVDATPLYNMVPPPGAPAALGADVANAGIYAHIIAGVRSEGDYGIEVDTPDVLALGTQPIFGIQAQVWGDPSDPVHDFQRGKCLSTEASPCPMAEPRDTAFLTLPASCPAQPIATRLAVDTWEQPGLFHEDLYESADLSGSPVAMSDCGALQFEPTIEASPTTNLIDSPSGLEFSLHQPQRTDLAQRGSAPLKDATVTLPPGMSANPSQADGLESCGSTQIGLSTPIGASPVHFSKAPAACPDASKLGTVRVRTPLLVERDADHKLIEDPETGEPIPRPLEGDVYLAAPFDNPFDSLLAIYLVVEDPPTGTVAKLAGQVIPDPAPGRLSTRFEENPQLPLEDVELGLFKGPRAPLITPPTCATHQVSTDLTPHSAPEAAHAAPSASFQSVAAPEGGTCPSTEGAAAHAPSFTAGTESPQAASYTPFALKLARNDGSQRLAEIDTTLAPGLSGKLAGVGRCSEAALAQAKAREHPNGGILERNDPSCPDSSKLGTVDVAAGAGPTPLHVGGTAYLAGPYKGAPLSIAVITPAVAGPFDLGAVLLRTALYVDPATAQIHAVSDPIPQIIEGIPLDVRSVALRMDRPSFTLNPTSCDPMAITGSALSALNQSAALNSPFQVGGCQQLPFKPKLSLQLKGGTKRAAHPKLIATLKAKGGEANIAKAQVKLPPSAFLDQAHIRTICTRVQFAADACPKGSIYGKASAVTPLLDEPLSGNVYLRSSNNKLPDLVVALKGPDSLPIEIELVGRTDSIKGALRNTFEGVPDAPVSSFRLELFGGKRGLVVNSRNLCARRYRAEVRLDGQNGKVFDTKPVVRSDCKGRKTPRRKRR
jgi:hypothetical protein